MNNFSLIQDVGLGDFLQVESFWTDEERAALETVYHPFDCPVARGMRDMFAASPTYRHVKHVKLEYPTQPVPGAYTTLRDAAVLMHKTFRGSIVLADDLDCELPDGLPDRYMFVHGATPFNTPSVRKHRDLTPDEWPAIVALLEARDAIGLVVNAAGAEFPPNDRLIDFAGKTSLPQAIEVLKRADGYIGIDSCFAILAAQLFGPDDLVIRTRNPWVVEQAWTHYPPHESFPFLVPTIGGPPHTLGAKPEPLTVVELKCNALIGLRNFSPPHRINVTPVKAAEMVECGQAVLVGDL